jgi:hypothetical protein
LLQKERTVRSRESLDRHSEERELCDSREMVLKPLAKHCKGDGYSRRLTRLLEGAGLEGIVSVGFSPDKAPHNESRGMVGFVVFNTEEQLDATCDDRFRGSYTTK